jgi:hypothetical protein
MRTKRTTAWDQALGSGRLDVLETLRGEYGWSDEDIFELIGQVDAVCGEVDGLTRESYAEMLAQEEEEHAERLAKMVVIEATEILAGGLK